VTPHVRQVWVGTGIDRVKTIAEAEERARKGESTIIHDHAYGRACTGACYEMQYEGEQIRISAHSSEPARPALVDLAKLRDQLNNMREVFFALADAVKSSNELYAYDEERADFRDAYDTAVEEVERLCSS
jgi:Mg2+ and Co2+ transporter CorA